MQSQKDLGMGRLLKIQKCIHISIIIFGTMFVINVLSGRQVTVVSRISISREVIASSQSKGNIKTPNQSSRHVRNHDLSETIESQQYVEDVTQLIAETTTAALMVTKSRTTDRTGNRRKADELDIGNSEYVNRREPANFADVNVVEFGDTSDDSSDTFKDNIDDVTDELGDVMITTYMRSGSSFLGRVLGFRHDTFYVYEPLWGMSRDHYFDGNRKCNTYRPGCVSSSGGRAATRALTQLHNCQLYKPPMANVFYPNINAKLSGTKWNHFRNCRKTKETEANCLKLMSDAYCKTSKFRVSKVLRLSLNLVEHFLETNPSLRVVHLFRDPRAMMNSHFGTRWSPIKQGVEQKVTAGAQAICHRIERDVKRGNELLQKYPNRFKIIQYEDFENPLLSVKKLYQFLKMPFSKEVLKFLDSGSKHKNSETSDASLRSQEDGVSKNSKSGNHPFKYRETLRWSTVKLINQQCETAMDMLGYRTFKTEGNFRNMSISAVKELKYKL